MLGTLYQLQSNAGPIWLAIQFTGTLLVTAAIMWFAFRRRRSSFRKKLDYVYFLFTIVGGAASAADLAISSWTKDSERIWFNYKIDEAYLPILVERYENMCRERDRDQVEREHSDNTNDTTDRAADQRKDDPFAKITTVPNSVLLTRLLSQSDCKYIDDVHDQLLVGSVDVDSLMSIHENVTETRAYNTGGQTEMLTPFNGGAAEVIDSIQDIDKWRRVGSALDDKLDSLRFMSVLKHLGPILLGIGLGIRLARSHYDVQAELAKEAREQSRSERDLVV